MRCWLLSNWFLFPSVFDIVTCCSKPLRSFHCVTPDGTFIFDDVNTQEGELARVILFSFSNFLWRRWVISTVALIDYNCSTYVKNSFPSCKLCLVLRNNKPQQAVVVAHFNIPASFSCLSFYTSEKTNRHRHTRHLASWLLRTGGEQRAAGQVAVALIIKGNTLEEEEKEEMYFSDV